MQTEKRRVLAVAIACLCIVGSGGVVATTHGHPTDGHRTGTMTHEQRAKTTTHDGVGTHDERSGTETSNETVQVEFVNNSTVVIHGAAERVGIGTTWYAPDGVATSYFEYGPLNGTTRIAVPVQGSGTTITYVTVYDDERATPMLTKQRPTAANMTTEPCRGESAA
ncbi:hypothetical protein ZOD2009_10295 [Haladaptatus paucihalophilus DX253]|uniref:Uncharacterized protein n=1 Tax=Haladaptatus paucihalophilus DX253 TaxID=797209 RepID=E7QTD1_HALPU|nr:MULTISPECIES: hypothetical protein [Haladaptatus]EFW91860.1 hypothetical protein ZOD2009_10295 [Haladaptatus paucihalophilus DX253]GKZ14026.1 hypothetical protein HAL_19070 [Haladaptatus sp. T7]SHK81389.1 hypothetical protein SAMN05444342_2262 [Haladaptatus paucihalophilus DX253]